MPFAQEVKLILAISAVIITIVILGRAAKPGAAAVPEPITWQILRRKDRSKLPASAAEIAELRRKAQDKEKRNLSIREFKDMPLKIRAIRNLDSDTWQKDLEIEIKNVGAKPIYSILAYLEFPDEKLPGDDVSGIVLRFGERKYIDIRVEGDPKDPHLNPGDTYIFTIDEKYRKGLETRHQRSPELFRHLDLHFGVISFGDGTGFEVGDPTDYRHIQFLTN